MEEYNKVWIGGRRMEDKELMENLGSIWGLMRRFYAMDLCLEAWRLGRDSERQGYRESMVRWLRKEERELGMVFVLIDGDVKLAEAEGYESKRQQRWLANSSPVKGAKGTKKQKEESCEG